MPAGTDLTNRVRSSIERFLLVFSSSSSLDVVGRGGRFLGSLVMSSQGLGLLCFANRRSFCCWACRSRALIPLLLLFSLLRWELVFRSASGCGVREEWLWLWGRFRRGSYLDLHVNFIFKFYLVPTRTGFRRLTWQFFTTCSSKWQRWHVTGGREYLKPMSKPSSDARFGISRAIRRNSMTCTPFSMCL